MIYVTFQYKALEEETLRYAVECKDVNQADKIADLLVHRPNIKRVRQSKMSQMCLLRIILSAEEFYEQFGKK